MTWRPSWLGGSDDDPDKKEQAKKDKEEFDRAVAAAVKTQVDPIMDRLKGLDSLSSFADDYKKDKEAAERKAQEEAEAKRRRDAAAAGPKKEDLAALILEDPQKAVDIITQGQQKLLLQTSALQVKSQVFNERAEEFPYYSGEIKAEVDKILGEQSLQFQNDPVAVANTYYTVVGRKQKEISENKIKSRFASASLNGSGGSGKGSEHTDDVDIEMTDDMRKAARMSGMSNEDYMKLVKQAAKSGALEMV